MPASHRLSGTLFIIISATSFGTLAIFGRMAYAAGLDIFTLLFLRFSFSAIILVGMLFIRREKLPAPRDLFILTAMGALGYVGQSICFLSAIKFASIGLVALLLYLYPVFVTILSILFLKSHMSYIKWIALGCATFGAMLTANPQGGNWLGIALALSAALIYSVYIIVGSGVMQRVSAIQSSAIIFTSASIVFAGLTFTNGANWPVTNQGWWAVGGITLIATVIPVATFLAGLKRIGPTNAAMISTLEPVVTVILGVILYQEVLIPLSLVGGGLILIAVIFLTYNEKQVAVETA